MPMDQVVGTVVFETRDHGGNLLSAWEVERPVFINLAGRPKIRYLSGFKPAERVGDGRYRVVIRRKTRLDS